MILNKIPSGTVNIPSSKSIGHRALICAALAGGISGGISGAEKSIASIRGLDTNNDINATKSGILKIISGDKSGQIDCGESGSTLRFLIPIAAALDKGGEGEWTFTGRGRLMERPLDIYKKIFDEHGAFFEQIDDCIRVRGSLSPGKYEITGDVSSQFITGMMFALSLLDGDSEIFLTTPLESSGYVDITADVMDIFGYSIPVGSLRINGGASYKETKFSVEGDWSQGAFFLCAGVLGARVSVDGLSLSSVQGDMSIMRILKSMGADVDATLRPGLFARKKSCAISAFVTPSGLKGTDIDVTDIPDLVPPIAAVLCYAKGTSRITGAGRLRLKESDRIAALVTELAKLGADICEDGDDIVVTGREYLDGGNVDAWNDHRIAMALAVASIGCKSPVYLTGYDSVNKSYPKFWEDFLRTENPNMKEAAYEHMG